MIGEECHLGDDTVDSPRAKRRRIVSGEDVTEIDGYLITAKATSKNTPAPKRLNSLPISVAGVTQEPLITGSAVAWFPPEEEDATVKDSPDPQVGIVMAVDSSSRKALVRPIAEWKDYLLDFWEENNVDVPERLDKCGIHAVASGSTLWIPTDELHIVGRAPSKQARKRFSSEILPSRLALVKGASKDHHTSGAAIAALRPL